MIQSMTGYGKSEVNFANKKIHIEVKALNSKSLDVSARIANVYREKELEIRKWISSELKRGKIDVSIWLEKETGTVMPEINEEAVKAYFEQMKKLGAELNIPTGGISTWEAIVRLPEVTTVKQQEEVTEEEWEAVRGGIEEAIKKLKDFRLQEGEALYEKFKQNLDHIEQLRHALVPFEESRVEKIRQRLSERLEELKDIDYDKNRLEQELIYYIEKLDINEEKQRLDNHLKYFHDTLLEKEDTLGKKLGFIAQEMGREINTTGSKSNQAEMQNIVVKMKDELEQIKEQVFNVL